MQRLGFTLVRQKGSHAILRKQTDQGELGCSIPMHREVDRFTLLNALKQAGVTLDEFKAALKG
jgi:predicted RNA binding protein YcfA (HicA-like mRNA interferase family)